MANIALYIFWAFVIVFIVFAIALLSCGLIVLIKITKDFWEDK